MEFAEKIVELKCRGFICIQRLEKLACTDGVTRYFKEAQYITCHKENDIETTIFDSNLKKLGWTGNDGVRLRIERASATISSSSTYPSAWCVETAKRDTVNMYTYLNTKKVRAALIAAESGIEITENCGIVPVFTYAVPSSRVSHYAVETKKMRDTLIASNESKIKSLVEKWELMKYLVDIDGKLITFEKYEMRNTDGAIRDVDTKRIIEADVPNLRVTIDGTTVKKRVERHRAYLSTFKMHERREHQDFIDHIDGNHSNNVPWNYRWVSRAENCLAKHSEMARRVVPDIDALKKLTTIHGEPSDPVVWNGWTFHRNMWIVRPNESYEKRFVARIGSGGYPVIGVTLKDSEDNSMKSRLIKCHIIVAYVFRTRLKISKGTLEYLQTRGKSASYFATSPMTDVEFAEALKNGGLVIMHSDDDKSNYSFDNLEIGTRSENALSRQDNPATTDRKRVKLIDIVSGAIQIFGSHVEAATHTDITQRAVSVAATFNGQRDIETYRKTTSRKTGMTYYIVDAIDN